jgi:hypothetical protein
VAKIQYDQKIMEKESEKKIADIEGKKYNDSLKWENTQLMCFEIKILVEMHVNREKSLADAAFYKALKETESNKVNENNY